MKSGLWLLVIGVVLACTGRAHAAEAAGTPVVLGPEGVTLAPSDALLSAREVTTLLFKSDGHQRIDLSRRTLRGLDLSGLDFKSAQLKGADLYGADLSTANLRGTDLSGAILNRTTIIRADFSGADLHGAAFMRPSVSTTLDYDAAEAPLFSGADMRSVRFTGHMEGADFRGANLAGGRFGPHEPRADISSMPSSMLLHCDFSGATMTGIDLSRAVLTFSRFIGADLRRASLDLADLSRADLSGADLTGADLTNANLDGAILAGVRGFDTVRGRDTIRNLDRAIR